MKAVVDSKSFKELVDKTKRFVSKSNNNYLMRYIHIVVDADAREVRAEAADGCRFSVAYCGLLETDESFECFITPDIPKITKRDVNVEIELIDNKAFITVEDSIRGYRQPQGKFYDLKEIINPQKEPAFKIGFNAKIFSEALSSVKDKSSTLNYARLYFYNPEAPVIIHSNEKDIAGVLPITISDDRLENDEAVEYEVKRD